MAVAPGQSVESVNPSWVALLCPRLGLPDWALARLSSRSFNNTRYIRCMKKGASEREKADDGPLRPAQHQKQQAERRLVWGAGRIQTVTLRVARVGAECVEVWR